LGAIRKGWRREWDWLESVRGGWGKRRVCCDWAHGGWNSGHARNLGTEWKRGYIERLSELQGGYL